MISKATEETAENYTEAEDAESNRNLVFGNGYFREWQVGPFGAGTRQLWLTMTRPQDTGVYMGMMLIYLLIEKQKEFNKFTIDLAKKGGTPTETEMAWTLAAMHLQRITADRVIFRANVSMFLDKVENKGAEEMAKMAAEILTKADKEDVDPEPDNGAPEAENIAGAAETALELGKSAPRP